MCVGSLDHLDNVNLLESLIYLKACLKIVTMLKGYPLYVHILVVGSWPLIIAHNKLSALDDLSKKQIINALCI
jgi:hypothetical protein